MKLTKSIKKLSALALSVLSISVPFSSVLAANLTEQEAKEILERNDYRVMEHLGDGAASHVFKASRVSQKTGKEKTIAAKVCYPSLGSWASLKNELAVAEVLKVVKEKLKSSPETSEQLHRFSKYLIVPKLKQRINEGKENEIAVFEAPLADSDLVSVGTELSNYEDVALSVIPDPVSPSYTICSVKNIHVNYIELKRVIKSVLKGLKAIHDLGLSHNDIAHRNVLRRFDEIKGKYRYFLTDFGTLRPGKPFEDLENASRIFLCSWLVCLGMNSSYVYRTVFSGRMDYYFSGNLDKEGVTGLTLPNGFHEPDNCFNVAYFPNKEDMEFVNFCQKLYKRDFRSADETLADPWLNKQ